MSKYFFILLLFLAWKVNAQLAPVYNHFYNNPYLINPAEVGMSGYMSFDFNHRQQWRGIEGAPVVSTFTFQTPFSYKKASVGVTIRNFERGLLNTNDLLFTYSYRAYLTKITTLNFGISAGLTSNTIDLNAIDDPDDPVLVDYTSNNMQPIANAGFKLTSKSGLNIGISLPRLFSPTYLNPESFTSYEFSPFDEVQFVTYFKKPLEKKIVTRKYGRMKRRVEIEDPYAPLQLYFLYKYSKVQDQRIEVLATLNLTENFWVGGSYRMNYGASGLLGLKIKNFLFSYAYEPASEHVEGLPQGTHEVQLTLRIGEKKKIERSKPILRTLEKTETHRARFSADDISEGGDDQGDGNLKKYYVVIKSFKDFNSADEFVRRMAERELYTNIFYNNIDKKYHVYSFQTYKLKEANEQRRAVQELTKYKSVTIITVQQ
ncbi:PorP/SprF family type IX secretion system membrane protein [Fulvivirga sediminis]|uniref:PorP/SprF family type IX secretion system membrane protein n=1 Tax=Fulvivirga sediminis TaxID=2803949 RepID=A0A937K1G4_9BACT|nr:PorP/SprF family type IX secretion system membrane protein [Fulvivirga sediminis]MBL3657310.1 PorP/SprF family type IX secretion system membrane protein [Fulvivirga sediminis]